VCMLRIALSGLETLATMEQDLCRSGSGLSSVLHGAKRDKAGLTRRGVGRRKIYF
jgi:hypothetical protein